MKTTVQRARREKGIATWAAVLLALLAVLAILSVAMRGHHDGTSDTWKAPYYGARDMVMQKLKAPMTADFSNPLSDEQTGATEMGNGVWLASGFVDAANTYGAKLRQEWEVIYKPSNGVVYYTRIGDQETGDRANAREAAGL